MTNANTPAAVSSIAHYAEKDLEVAGKQFKLTMGKEGPADVVDPDGDYFVQLFEYDDKGELGEEIDTLGSDTLEQAKALFDNPPISRIERFVETGDCFDILL